MSRGSSFRVDGQSRDPLTVNPLVNRTPGRGWSRCSSPFESPNHSCWRELHRHEQIRRVDVVLAGFVDHSKVTLARSLAVGKHLIDLARLQILQAVVVDTESKRTGRLLNFINVSPESA